MPESHLVKSLVPVAALIALALAGCGGPKPFGGEPGPPPAGMLFGFNEDLSVRDYDLQASLGMPVRRFPVSWGDAEPTPGQWSWAQSDPDYTAMRAKGLKPLLVAIGAPCWTGSADSTCRDGTLTGPPDPSHLSDWADYVRRLVARYPNSVGVEVWNEPNITGRWAPHPDPVAYTMLLKAAYTAVKSVNPKMPVISGGLFAAPRTGGFAISDTDFLHGLYAAGARGYMDGIGAHPYPITQGGGSSGYELQAMKDSLRRLRSIRDAAGDSATPLWITEMGVSTASAPGFPAGASEGAQADDLLTLVHALGQGERVPVALIHRLVDPPYTSSDGALAQFESGFGVFNDDGTPKPAACELSREFHGSLSC